jgi:hypothetical protein
MNKTNKKPEGGVRKRPEKINESGGPCYKSSWVRKRKKKRKKS